MTTTTFTATKGINGFYVHNNQVHELNPRCWMVVNEKNNITCSSVNKRPWTTASEALAERRAYNLTVWYDLITPPQLIEIYDSLEEAQAAL